MVIIRGLALLRSRIITILIFFQIAKSKIWSDFRMAAATPLFVKNDDVTGLLAATLPASLTKSDTNQSGQRSHQYHVYYTFPMF